MSPWSRPLGAKLPYWSIFAAGEKGTDDGGCGIILLKDGHVAVALDLAGFDASAADESQRQSEAEAVAGCLEALPAGFVLQATFETSPHPPLLAHAYAAQGAPHAHPILRRSRQARAQMLLQDDTLLSCRTVWWLGTNCPDCLPGDAQASGALSGQERALGSTMKRVLQVARLMQTKLAPHHPKTNVLSAEALLACCHSALNPHRADVGPPAWPPLEPGRHALADLLPLSALRVQDNGLTLGAPSLLWRALGVLRLPEAVGTGLWPDLLLKHAPQSPYHLVVTHRVPRPARATAQLAQRRKALWALVGSVFANHAARQAYEETEEVLARLQVGDRQLVHTSLTLLISGATAEALDRHQTQLQEALAGEHIVVAPMLGDQLTGWLSTLPAYGQRARHTHPLMSDAAAHLTPRLAPATGDVDADLLLHTRQRGLRKLSVRLNKRQDASAIMVGKTGSGKTFLFCALLKDGCLGLGGHAIIADVKGPRTSAYRPLCELLGGQYVHLQNDTQVGFNPFPCREEVAHRDGSTDLEKLSVVRVMLAMMGGSGDETRLGVEDVHFVLGKVLQRTYMQSAASTAPITLSDAVCAFESIGPLSDHLRATSERLRERLSFWCSDPLRRRLFDTPRAPPIHKQLTVFDFYGLEQDSLLGAVLVTALTGAIERKMSSLPITTPKLFGFDEAWALFDGHAEAAALLNRLYRTARSFGACCYLLTQSHQDIAQSAAANGVLQNIGLIYLMRHQTDHQAAGTVFGLHRRSRLLLESLRIDPNVFAETLLIDANIGSHYILRYTPTPFEIWCGSSRPQELEMLEYLCFSKGYTTAQAIEVLVNLCPFGAPQCSKDRKNILDNLFESDRDTNYNK